MPADGPWLPIAIALYVAAAASAVLAATWSGRLRRLTMPLLGLALAIHGIAIIVRWLRLDHGPYVDLFEILSSNVWSLHAAVFVACLAIRDIRPSLATALPALQVLVLWLAVVPSADADPHVTYATVWLAVHVWLGKIFLGCAVVALGLSLAVLVRRLRSDRAFGGLPPNLAIDELAYRFVIVGFVFETLMLVAGAIWAQDAWGRYWAWDPLETWSFITWLAVAAYLHLRVTRRPSPTASAVMVLLIFGLAFSTFFGMPFVSTAPHKGAV